MWMAGNERKNGKKHKRRNNKFDLLGPVSENQFHFTIIVWCDALHYDYHA